MADEQNRAACTRYISYLSDAFLLKRRITHSQHLVNHKYFRIEVRSNRESQTDKHPSRISFHRSIQKFLNSRESHDFVKSPIDFRPLHPQYRAVEIDVLAAGQLRMKAGSYFEQRSDAPVDFGIAFGRFGDA